MFRQFRSTTRALLLVLALAAPASMRAQAAIDTAGIADVEAVLVRVQNRSWTQVEIFLQLDSTWARVGVVAGFTERVFPIPSAQLGDIWSLRFLAIEPKTHEMLPSQPLERDHDQPTFITLVYGGGRTLTPAAQASPHPERENR